jgi:hypothetical protein
VQCFCAGFVETDFTGRMDFIDFRCSVTNNRFSFKDDVVKVSRMGKVSAVSLRRFILLCEQSICARMCTTEYECHNLTLLNKYHYLNHVTNRADTK